MLRKENQGIVWLEFEILQRYPSLQHAIFTRSSSATQSAFVAAGIDAGIAKVSCNQVHGPDVHIIEQKPDSDTTISHCDGLITNCLGTALIIKHADCQAALFYDPNKQCLAMVHAGWRGSCHNIYKKTLDSLLERYGSAPKDIVVCISPSLGPTSAQFIHYEKELPTEFYRFKSQGPYFDFWKISRWQLESAGIQPNNIEIASLCTYSDPELFFSYRRDKTTERHISVACLKPYCSSASF